MVGFGLSSSRNRFAISTAAAAAADKYRCLALASTPPTSLAPLVQMGPQFIRSFLSFRGQSSMGSGLGFLMPKDPNLHLLQTHIFKLQP